jgi:glycosyltransferase involved in cell wall biosynthesis
MNISVIICTRNRHETIGQAVESVANCDYKGFDIHIMDQSTDKLTENIVTELAAKYQQVCPIVYHHLSKAGLSAAYNTGMRVTTNEIMAFTDDDVIVPADWLTQIAKVFQNEPDAEILYGQVCIPADLADEVKKGIIVPALEFSKYKRLSLKEGFQVIGMGANMAIRRSLMDRVGGFDEALGPGGPLRASQDNDLAYRTCRFGGVIVLAPDVKVDHYGTRTPEQWPVTMKNYGIGDGAFYGKHIRCGDAGAKWMLAKEIIISRAREIKRALKSGVWQVDDYGRNLMVGYREGKAFNIDPKLRLYQESETGKMIVTESNPVTAAHKKR